MVKTELSHCSLCDEVDYNNILSANDKLYGCPGQFSYVKCKQCGLVFLSPTISDEDIADYYPDDYSPHISKEKPGIKCEGIRSLSKKQERRFMRDYGIKPAILNSLDHESKALDVGCGSGGFLNKIRKAVGCSVYGVDISELAVENARKLFGIDVFCGPVSEAPFQDNSFDLITAWSCLEHISDPGKTLCKMADLVKEDGVVLIKVPNIASFNARVFGSNWYHLDCPRHLTHFSPKTMSSFLDKCGLAITRIVYHTDAKGFVNSLRLRFGSSDVPLKQRGKMKNGSLLKKAVFPLTATLSMLGKSDLMTIYARRK